MTQFVNAMTDESRRMWIEYCREFGVEPKRPTVPNVSLESTEELAMIMEQPTSGRLAALLAGAPDATSH